ncbi:MAG: hypothetical protein ACRDNW_02210, partial [Trebonia sp.]
MRCYLSRARSPWDASEYLVRPALPGQDYVGSANDQALSSHFDLNLEIRAGHPRGLKGGQLRAASGHARVRGVVVVSVLPEQVRLSGHRLGSQVVQPLGERLFLLPGRWPPHLRVPGPGAAMDYLNSRTVADADGAACSELLIGLGEVQAKLTAAHAALPRRFDAADSRDADGCGS